MTPEDLLALLVTHRQSLAAGLHDEEDREEVAAALREVREAVTAGRSASPAVRRLRRALSALPPEHPVSDALGSRRYAADGTGGRALPTADAIGTVLNLLETRDATAVPDPGPPLSGTGAEPGPDAAKVPPVPGPGELLAKARERLLSAPALTEREHAALLSSHGDQPGLIRLADPRPGGSTARCPRFQFRPGTLQPLPVVLRINGLLRADLDPWGAADWWLGANSWLHGVPADLLGTLPDEELEGAALELVEAD
ncbi:hypothetical protein [Streptomyces griseoloalbus]|uniref:Uncharacterized protein n=1 Tax=Streptomyces griseoloalbus TaxID=67303 RepID=A0A7W8BVG4_9ACTN|nr:hypothetical protein [Streptomyces albaduncus]MBB5128369.1 hypothetical protein [Streptomyces albaduncus]GGV70134.1 hypothetical protein GCM10010294_27900 [Streptomyces griseoloalbus]GGW73900.1 hypothetical protein GCM10010340_60310 [Streptomyces albaduncus]